MNNEQTEMAGTTTFSVDDLPEQVLPIARSFLELASEVYLRLPDNINRAFALSALEVSRDSAIASILQEIHS